MKHSHVLTFVLLMIILLLSINLRAEEPNWQPYEELLASSIKQGTKDGFTYAMVDYESLKKSGKLDAIYKQLSTYPLEKLVTKQEKLAFFINTYNVLAMKMVVDNWPLKSIKDAGSFFTPVWKKEAGEIGDKKITLYEIEHKILRPMGEPRIHVAIVCASISCPDLLNKPYKASELESQLDLQMKLFLNNAKKGLYIDNNKIHISKIFSWFEADFKTSGGIDTFIRRYRTDLPLLPVNADIDYNWNVNSTPSLEAK